MNERIRKLFSKSCWDEQAEVDIEDFISVEKFAELIVRECLNECWYDATPKQISDNIKMKFGVEE